MLFSPEGRIQLNSFCCEAVLEDTTALAVELHRAYPEASRFKDKIPVNIQFVQATRIPEIEKEDVPKGSLRIYNAMAGIFKSFGIPETEAERFYYQASARTPIYTSYEQGRIYFPEETLYKLNSQDLSAAIPTAVSVGSYIIEETIRTLSYRVNPTQLDYTPWGFFWRFMMAPLVDNVFQEVEKSQGKVLRTKKDRMRFRSEKSRVAYFFTEEGAAQLQAQFVAVGAKVLYLLPGQSLISAESSLGIDYYEGSVKSLALPAKQIFVNLLAEKLGANIKFKANEPSFEQTEAEKVNEVLNLRGKKLFHAFVYSLQPLMYMHSNNPKLNPFRYAEAAEE